MTAENHKLVVVEYLGDNTKHVIVLTPENRKELKTKMEDGLGIKRISQQFGNLNELLKSERCTSLIIK